MKETPEPGVLTSKMMYCLQHYVGPDNHSDTKKKLKIYLVFKLPCTNLLLTRS